METPSSGGDDILLKGPTNRGPMNSVRDWVKGKRIDDGAEGLWRVHDGLYDFTTFVKNHPGGREWLEVTKGTDITEAFECSHVASDRAEKVLKKYYVREAKSPRNSLITFHENGFYKTLQRKVRERKLLSDMEPLAKTKLFTDSIAIFFFVTALLGTVRSLWWAVVSGVFLNMLTICAHNFFHKKDSWRMYYFSLSLMSVSEWRISHALSHHLYPNTKLDLEVSLFEPLLRFLPREDKKLRYTSTILTPFVMVSAIHFQVLRRIIQAVLSKGRTLRSEDLVGVSFYLFLLLAGGRGPWHTFRVWTVIILSTSFFFMLVGLTAAHHHPDIYHDGDFLGSDKDFGLLQIAAVRDREDVDGNFMKTMVMFGEHTLHHLFPTVDHAVLPALNPVLEETCREFNIKYRRMTSGTLFLGMFRQLVRNYRNSRLLVLEQ